MAAERSLQTKLLVWLLLPLLLILAIGSIGGWIVAGRLADRVYDRELLEIANELSLHLGDADGRPRLVLSEAAERLLLLDQEDRVGFRIETRDGAPVAGDPTLPAPPRGVQRPRFFAGEWKGEKVAAVAVEAPTAEAAEAPLAVIEVAETRNKRQRLTREILLSIIGPQLLLILVAAGVVSIGVEPGLAPLRRLQRAIAVRSHLDLAPIEKTGVPSEVEPLLAAINELMARLQTVLGFQGRFIADAAHQLRTPVAGLKATIEVALRESGSAGKRGLAEVYIGVERLSRLVAQLLSLARNEPSAVPALRFAALDLRKLVFSTTAEWVPEAYKKEIDLGFEGPERAIAIEGDALRLKEPINNLIDNAIRYSRAGGRVTIAVADEPQPHFSVSDDGPTIPQEERQRIFDRFHRLLGSGSEGVGLGLAIVREIAELHRAEVSLGEDSDGIGNRFTVSFPAQRAADSPSRLREREGPVASATGG
jgi:two-component system sensor histidine kinase TctE